MNAKERVHKALNHEEADRIPSFEDEINNLSICNYYGEKYIRQGVQRYLKIAAYLIPFKNRVLKKLLSSKNLIKRTQMKKANIWRRAGLDLMTVGLSMLPVKYFKWGYVDEYGRVFKCVKNPSDNMDILYYKGGYFKDFDDYESFNYPDIDDERRKINFQVLNEINEESNGEIYLIPGFSALMEMTWEAFGLDNFSRLMAKPKKIRKIFDDRGKFALELTKRCIEWGTELIWIWDDYGFKTGLFMNPKYYQNYIFPWLKRICDYAHKNEVKILLHSCGDILPIFKDLIDCGIDSFNPIEPTTANPDYDIFKLKEQYGNKITLIGNVSPQDLADKDPEFIINYTKKLIKECGPGGGFILASGHSIFPKIKLENFLAMRETAVKFGVYPINILD